MRDGWSGRRVLVTGATGMIGSWLAKELLDAGATVTALVLDEDPQSELVRSGAISRCGVVNGALEDFRTIERAVNVHETDTVFHLGAQTLVEAAQRFPMATWETNVRGTWNVLEACRVHRDLVQRVVVASSDKAYGEATSLPYTEETPLAARFPYEVSKACADLIAQSYHHAYGLPVSIARCGNIFGGGDLNWSRIVPGTIRSLVRGERPVLRSDGSYRRDYLYVKDAARAYMALASAVGTDGVAGAAFNFGPQHPLSAIDLVGVIARLMDRDGVEPVIEDRTFGEIRDQWLSSRRASDVLGWRPDWQLEDGLTETIGWYREFLG